MAALPSSLSAPAVPSGSVYLGAWVNPNHLTGAARSGQSGEQELSQLPAFTAAVGGAVTILHVYAGFKAPVPFATLDSISATGAVPLDDWGCTKLTAITSGVYDNVIREHAQALKSYGKPVFLRWYWEFNQRGANARRCGGFADPAGFIAAWRHIWTIFHDVGATNVAFVWCPGLQGQDPSPYYPGNRYVDWIGVDGYDRSYAGVGSGDFAGIFGPFYSEWAAHGKPMMVAETGATPGQQAQFLGSIQSQAPTMPLMKAIVYFDSIGPRADWVLQGPGITAFSALRSDSYFSFGSRA
jgi:beta-mannanase